MQASLMTRVFVGIDAHHSVMGFITMNTPSGVLSDELGTPAHNVESDDARDLPIRRQIVCPARSLRQRQADRRRHQ